MGLRPAGCECRLRHEADTGSRNPNIFSGNFIFIITEEQRLRPLLLLFFHGRGRNKNALLPVTSFPVKSERAVAKNSLSHGFAAPAPSRREPDMTVSCEASLIEGGGIA